VPSGIDHFELYESRNGAPFALAASSAGTAVNVPASPGSRYAFFSLAVDRAGNREAPHAVPDAVTRVDLLTQGRRRHRRHRRHHRHRRHRRHRHRHAR
jgi:hypothetical protein